MYQKVSYTMGGKRKETIEERMRAGPGIMANRFSLVPNGQGGVTHRQRSKLFVEGSESNGRGRGIPVCGRSIGPEPFHLKTERE